MCWHVEHCFFGLSPTNADALTRAFSIVRSRALKLEYECCNKRYIYLRTLEQISIPRDRPFFDQPFFPQCLQSAIFLPLVLLITRWWLSQCGVRTRSLQSVYMYICNTRLALRVSVMHVNGVNAPGVFVVSRYGCVFVC